jgi:phage-related protein
MKTALRAALRLLGVVMGWSAIQHWLPSAALGEHYREVGIGEYGRITVAFMQSVAAVGLLVNQLQLAAAAILAAVMSVVAVRNAYVGEFAKTIEPLLIAAWAAVPALWLRRVLAARHAAK